jgi:hypothetical protein
VRVRENMNKIDFFRSHYNIKMNTIRKMNKTVTQFITSAKALNKFKHFTGYIDCANFRRLIAHGVKDHVELVNFVPVLMRYDNTNGDRTIIGYNERRTSMYYIAYVNDNEYDDAVEIYTIRNLTDFPKIDEAHFVNYQAQLIIWEDISNYPGNRINIQHVLTEIKKIY